MAQVAYDMPLELGRWFYAHATRQCVPPLPIEVIEHNDLETATLLGEADDMIDMAEHARGDLVGHYSSNQEDKAILHGLLEYIDDIIGQALFAEDELLEATNQHPKYDG